MARLLNLFRRRRERLELDLNRELRDHLDRRRQDLIAAGMPAVEADRQAKLELGGVSQVREAVRDTWTWGWLDAVRPDVRHALRRLKRSPAFTLGVGTVLTIAIGANVTLFTVVNAALLRPLDYPDAERLVTLETQWHSTGRLSPNVSGPDFLDWQKHSDLFDAVAAWYGEEDVATLVGGHPVFANDRYVSADFFTVFGQSAAAGRLLSPADVPTGDGDPAVAIAAYDWATRHFGSPQLALGQTVTVYSLRVTIVGVAAQGFRYPGQSDIWMPWLTANGGTNRNLFNYQAIGKLKAGVSMERAEAQMAVIARRLAAEYPDNRDRGVAVVSLQDRITGPLQSTLWMLMSAAGLVLLIAGANVANLQLARAGRQSRELALRSALGAGRRRVTQHVLIEHTVLLAAVTVAGVALAALALRIFDTLSPVPLTFADITGEPAVVSFIAGMFLLSLVAFGVASTRAVSRTDVGALGAAGGRSVGAGPRPRLRSILVVAEVALSAVLLVAAGLLLRSFVSLQRVDLGFNPVGVVLAYTQYVVNDDAQRRQRVTFYTEVIDRLRRQPGVEAAAGITLLPMGREPRPAREFFIRGRPEGVVGQRPTTEVYGITPGYFDVLDVALRRGRAFADTDIAGQPPVAIINEALAAAVFPDGRVLGEQVRWGLRGPWLEIVGVVGNTRWQSPSVPPPPMIYVPSAQGFGGSLSLVVRTSTNEAQTANLVQTVLRQANPDVPVRIETMNELFASALMHPRLRVQVTAAFAVAAAVLAALGIFSVLLYLVTLRTREIAVRRAVGAGTMDILSLVVTHGTRLVAAGLVVGLIAAAAVARLLQSLLYVVSPWDPAVYVAVTAVLGLAAALAIVLPAIRATSIAPVVALQQE
jgi:predicted permease